MIHSTKSPVFCVEWSLGFLTRVDDNITWLYFHGKALKFKTEKKEKRMESKVKRSAIAQSDSFKHQDLKQFTKRLAEHFKRPNRHKPQPEIWV